MKISAGLFAAHQSRKGARFPRRSSLEYLESRIAPAYTAALAGMAATFTGDAANDTLSISAENGQLRHNRFTAGDAGFASDLDFDSTVAGVQMLAADAASSVAIGLGAGTDMVILGGDGHAARLKASFIVTNTGADGDVLEINDADGTAADTADVSAGAIAGTFNITSTGATFGTLTIRTGSAADTITFIGTFATSYVFETGAGNDTVTGSNGTSPAKMNGGDGNDILNGGDSADVIHGGEGSDTIFGRRGNDMLFGDGGVDTFVWNPGDGSDTIEGGSGTDLLTFNGANISEIITYSAVTGRFQLFRNVANIVMDTDSVEQVELNLLGGADTVNVGDLSTTAVRALRFNFAAILGTTTPDGQVDALTLNGTDFDDDARVTTDGGKVQVMGFGLLTTLTGFDANDQLNVVGGTGLDNVFATSGALSALAVTLSGETASGAPGALNFSAPASYDTGKGPSAIASGNLFGNASIISNDLVIANAKSNSISILQNSGNGTFLPAVQLGTGGNAPKSVVLEDFNNDTRLDIAVTNSGSANVAVFLNNGDGTFAPPTLFPTGKNPGILRAGDVTGDGKIDLVMITADNKLTRLAGDGNGGFGARVKLATGGLAPTDLVLADFSSDGLLDIAVANSGSHTVTFLKANPDFTFAAPVKTRVGVQPSALAAGDFDGDGRLDLAVSHAVSRFVSVLLNPASATGFNPQIKITYPGRNAPTAIAVADLDRDGHDDIVLANAAAGSVGVLLNTGAATFRPASFFGLDNTPLRKSSALTLADFNSDGRLDIAVANAGTSDMSALIRIPV